MENVVNMGAAGALFRVTAGTTAPAIIPATSPDTEPSAVGTYKFATRLRAAEDGSQGVYRQALIIPGFAAGSQNYTLTIFGYRFGGSSWIPYVLLQLTVTSNTTPSGAADAETIGASDTVAGTLVAVAGAAAASYELTSYGTAVGVASVLLNVRSSPYLYFQTSVDGAFALVSRH